MKDTATRHDTEPVVDDFLRLFELDPIRPRTDGLVEAPPWPPKTTCSADAVRNYRALEPNAANGYGLTGLMSVVPWSNICYHDVETGTVFLFPGTYEDPPPPYTGTHELNCMSPAPMDTDHGVLHVQMCALLGQPTTNFIGFGVKFPYNTPGNVGYNSGTCNEYWFGSRTLPADWQKLVYQALEANLPT